MCGWNNTGVEYRTGERISFHFWVFFFFSFLLYFLDKTSSSWK